MFHMIGYQLAHPEAAAFQISTALLYPILLIEMVLLAIAVFEAGRFSIEMVARWRHRRSVAEIERAATAAKSELAAGLPAEAASRLAELRHGLFVESFGRELVGNPDFRRTSLMKRLTDLEFAVSKRLERTRLLIRLGPMLGLMTTLIPISPALIGLARGDVKTLSANLVVAFSTTVIGLLIGALGYVMTAVRDRLYARDVSDVEYALEMLEV